MVDWNLRRDLLHVRQCICVGWDGFEQLSTAQRRSAREEARALMASRLARMETLVNETFRGEVVGFTVTGSTGGASPRYYIKFLYINEGRLAPFSFYG